MKGLYEISFGLIYICIKAIVMFWKEILIAIAGAGIIYLCMFLICLLGGLK
jgi:hypothetical protein